MLTIFAVSGRANANQKLREKSLIIEDKRNGFGDSASMDFLKKAIKLFN